MTAADGLRPHRVWYAVGGTILALGVLAGMAVIALNLVSSTTGDPGLRDRFAPGETAVVALDPRRPPAVYAAETSSGFDLPQTFCEVMSPSGEPVPVNPPGRKYRETRGDTTWAMVHVIDVPAADRYTITCRDTGSSAVSGFAIGDASRAAEAFHGFMGVLLGMGITGLAALVGGGIVLVTLLRRRTARRHTPPAVGAG